MSVDTERLRASCELSLKLDRRVQLAGLADRSERIALCEQTLALLAERDALAALLREARAWAPVVALDQAAACETCGALISGFGDFPNEPHKPDCLVARIDDALDGAKGAT